MCTLTGFSRCVLVSLALAPAALAQTGSSSLAPDEGQASPAILAPGPGGIADGFGASLMWVVENQSEQVFVVDVASLSATLVGPSGISVNFGGLGYDPATAILYAWSTDAGGSLYTVDQTVGTFGLVGSDPLFGADTFDIRPTDSLAIAWSVLGELHDIDLGSGAATFRVATTGSGIASAFGPDGTYYNLDRGDDILYTVDVDTGVRTPVGPLGIDVGSTNVAFNPDDGYLYAIEILDATYPLYRIDPSSGAAVVAGNVTGLPANSGQQITMSTFLIEGQGSSVLAIPAMSPYGLAVLGSALALVALVLLTRRRA